MTSQLPRLRSFSAGVRLGIAALSIVLLSGLAASAVHMKLHYENRDEKPGFTLEDLEGAYHGVSSEAPLRAALERGHPEELGQAERDALMKWLDGDSLSTDYDNLDLGDDAPAEIIAFACLDCHSRSSEDAVGKTIPLEFWDDVAGLAISREIMPTPPSVLLASMHAHTISLANLHHGRGPRGRLRRLVDQSIDPVGGLDRGRCRYPVQRLFGHPPPGRAGRRTSPAVSLRFRLST
jgi:hypothetical protein